MPTFCYLCSQKYKEMMKDNQEERFPLVDEVGRVIGSATRGECHNGSKLLHPVVHLHVFNSRGEVYLQKRPEWKDIQPGKWDTSVGGHIDYGETPELALTREVREELGIAEFTPERVKSIHQKTSLMVDAFGHSKKSAPPSANKPSPPILKVSSSAFSSRAQLLSPLRPKIGPFSLNSFRLSPPAYVFRSCRGLFRAFYLTLHKKLP